MKSLCIILALFLSGGAIAQTNSVVKLKNGSEIRGNLLSQDEQVIRIQTKDGSVWTYSADEVETIGKFQPKVQTTGYFVRPNLGIMGGSQVSPSFQLVNGYSFNEHWDLGLGLGLESFWWDQYIPVFVEGRYNLLNKPFTPFVNVMAGYEVPVSNWNFNKGGFTTGTRVGVTRYIGNRVALSTSLGYRYAYLVEENSWWDDFVTIREANRFDFRIGLTIK